MEKLKSQISKIEKKLNYTFKDKNLLLLAFVHRSYANEHREVTHNERLEFLGDSILGLLIADHLYHTLPNKSEGELSAVRARLVQASSCIYYAQQLQVSEYLLLGKGEKMNDGRGRESIVSDLFEAILGAIYLDGDLNEVKKFFFSHFKEPIDQLMAAPPPNWKALLQDYCQKNYQIEPSYLVSSISGPDHNKQFVVAVVIDGEELARGQGSSIKSASQEAAMEAIKCIEEKHGR